MSTTERPSRKWLEKMAEGEDEAGSVSVGGLAADMGMLSTTAKTLPTIYAVVWDDVLVCDTSRGFPIPVTRMGEEEAREAVREIGADRVELYIPAGRIHELVALLRSEVDGYDREYDGLNEEDIRRSESRITTEALVADLERLLTEPEAEESEEDEESEDER